MSRPESDERGAQTYELRLYVAGTDPRSRRTVASVTDLCERHLAGRYRLEAVDLSERPELAREAALVASPALVREWPAPRRTLIGHFSDERRVLAALGLPTTAPPPPERAGAPAARSPPAPADGGGARTSAPRDSPLPYHALLEQVSEAALIVSTLDQVLYQNASATILLGRDLTGGPFAELFEALDGDEPSVPPALLADGDRELRLRRSDGQSLPVRLSSRAVAVDGARFHAVVLADLRERERLRVAEAASAAKNDFLALLGHEIRNPLGALAAAVELLEAPPATDEAVLRDARALMERQLGHVEALVADLLDVGRIEQGKLALGRAPLELGALLGAALETSRRAAEAGGVSLRRLPTPEPLWVEGDPVRLRQVLDNLVRNAIEASEAGGEVRLRAGVAGAREVFFEVSDGGCGIAPEQLTRVFERFVQAREGGERSGGLGLGLALARSLVEAHGGRLEAHSAGLGHGARFRVTLPRRASPPGGSVAARAPTSAPGRVPQRILLIDDHHDTLEILARMLERAGHSVVAVATTGAAQAALAAGRFDVLLTDVGLADDNGIAFARALRRAGAFDGAFVALTGFADAATRRELETADFAACLTKPVRLAELLGTLERIGAGGERGGSDGPAVPEAR